MDVKNCIGCEDNFYNGHNPYGIQKCWMLDKARLVPKIAIGTWDPPPYSQAPVPTPSCYHKNGMVFIIPEALDSKGYWAL